MYLYFLITPKTNNASRTFFTVSFYSVLHNPKCSSCASLPGDLNRYAQRRIGQFSFQSPEQLQNLTWLWASLKRYIDSNWLKDLWNGTLVCYTCLKYLHNETPLIDAGKANWKTALTATYSDWLEFSPEITWYDIWTRDFSWQSTV